MSAEQPGGPMFTDDEIKDVLRGLVLVVAEQHLPVRVTELFDLAYRVEKVLRAAVTDAAERRAMAEDEEE